MLAALPGAAPVLRGGRSLAGGRHQVHLHSWGLGLAHSNTLRLHIASVVITLKVILYFILWLMVLLPDLCVPERPVWQVTGGDVGVDGRAAKLLVSGDCRALSTCLQHARLPY